MAYRELLQSGDLVACLWLSDASHEPRGHRVLPDACVDIVLAAGRLTVAGPATGDRQLRRRFADAVGYGPKTLERILRA